MSDTIIVAIIACVGSLGGSFFGILTSNRLVNYRIDQLEKKVDLHNKVVERVYTLENKTDVQNEQIKVANHRIDDLEVKVG